MICCKHYAPWTSALDQASGRTFKVHSPSWPRKGLCKVCFKHIIENGEKVESEEAVE